MPVFAADVLPDTTGRNLGSPPQRWNIFAQNLDIQSLSGMPVVFSGVFYSATASVTANQNVVSPTTQNLDACTIPGGLLNNAGKVLRGTMGGTWTIQSGQTPNMGIFVNLGGLQIFGISASGMSGGQSNLTWRAMWEAVVYASGTSGQLVRHGQYISRYTVAGGNETMNPLIDVNYVPQGPIDLTQDQVLQAGCYFTTNTSPANSVTQDIFIVEVLN